MDQHDIIPEELWSRQQISGPEVDYGLWEEKREAIREFARLSGSCIFTVDVFKRRYDFASKSFSTVFGFPPTQIRNIREQGDLLEERIHPDDRKELREYQIEHGQFIYSLPAASRNAYRQIFQLRILDVKEQYINVISRH